jgi:hypothetical protein
MREFFVNADFDLSLRRGKPPRDGSARIRQAKELPLHMLFLGLEGDTVLAPDPPGGDFLDYLQRQRIPVPDVRMGPSFSVGARFTPFGWNGEADLLNRRYAAPAPHPELDVVRRVNGRTFALEVERRHWGGLHAIGVVRSVDELEDIVDGRPPDENGWLVKSEHGNGALGNRRIRSRLLRLSDRETVDRFLAEDERAVVERWRPRTADLATVFSVGEAAEPLDLFSYEVVNTADGAFIGDLFDRSSPEVERWRSDLRSMADIVARELAAAGYFGPVCVDSFVWDDRGERRLRPVVDINARLSVAAAAERLWRMWGCDRILYWRLFSSRKLRLPETFSELERALGDDGYDPPTRCGILVASPMKAGGRRLRRLGVLIAGKDRREVAALDRRFRERFER